MTSATYITLICLAFVGAATAGSGWSYTDVTSWSKDNPNCAKKSQSPIDIKIDSVEDVDFEPFVFTKYNKYSSANLTNNGHTVQLDVKGLILSGGNLTENYETLQLHFHWSANNAMKGSEHAVDSKYYPLEMHIVHINSKYNDVNTALNHGDGLAVLGFFFKLGTESAQLKTITPDVDSVTSSGKSIKEFDLKGLISEATDSNKYFRYNGSLTTPPCSEAVIWTVYETPLSISQAQLDKFWKAKDSHGKALSNFRPPQSINQRKVYRNSSGMSKAFSVLVVFSIVLSYLS